MWEYFVLFIIIYFLLNLYLTRQVSKKYILFTIMAYPGQTQPGRRWANCAYGTPNHGRM
jgi:hypothetical protein